MAEIIGLVSGGAGIVSLAAQLLASAQALKGFVANVKNAPNRLGTLAFDIETLGMMLEEVKVSQRQDREAMNVLLDRCLSSVHTEVRVIVRHVEHLNHVLKKSRMRGRLWAAFEDPEIERTLDRLDRAKTSLLHAHLMYIEYASDPNGYLQSLADILSLRRTEETTKNQKALLTRLDRLLLNDPSSQTSGQAATDEKCLTTSEDWAVSRRTRRKLTQQRFSITLRSFVSHHVCTLMMSHATLLPCLSLRTWIQGSTSPAFEYCLKGDIIGLRKMLSDGQVRPRDRDQGNFTLLDIATLEGNTDICLLLMNQFGLRNDFEAMNDAMTVLAINPGKWTRRIPQYQEMFRFLLEKSTIDYDIDEDSPRVDAVPDWLFACPDTDTVEMILRNQLVFDPKTPLFRPDQILDLGDAYVYRLESPEVLLALFNIEWSFMGLAKLPYEVQRQILHLAAKKIGVRYFHCPSHWCESGMPWSQSRWLGLARDLVEVGVEPTAIVNDRTPLLSVWRFSTPRWDQHPGTLYDQDCMHAMFDCWIQTMSDASVDLLEYIQREQQAWLVLETEWYSGKAAPRSSLLFRPYRVETLISGSRPTDCSFTVRRQKTLHVWQELDMPGSWQSGIRDAVGNAVVVTLEDESPGIHCQRARSITTLSEPVDIRCFQEHDRMRDVRLRATLETTQDDAAPLALGNLWRERDSRRTARRRSRSSPPGEFHSSQQVNERWTSGWRTRLLIHHLWPITMFENSPLVEEHGPCQCFKSPLPEFHEYRPAWYRVVCVEEYEGL